MSFSFLPIFSMIFIFGQAHAQAPTQAAPGVAQADLESKSGSQVKGHLDFKDTPEGLEIRYKISGLKKNQSHGFHIHEHGDCSAPDAKSAGMHYVQVAPTGGTALNAPQKFAGDLPMLQTNAKGEAEGRVVMKDLTVNRANPVTGHAVIVHEGPDDVTKPSTKRIACAVIK